MNQKTPRGGMYQGLRASLLMKLHGHSLKYMVARVLQSTKTLMVTHGRTFTENLNTPKRFCLAKWNKLTLRTKCVDKSQTHTSLTAGGILDVTQDDLPFNPLSIRLFFSLCYTSWCSFSLPTVHFISCLAQLVPFHCRSAWVWPLIAT